MIKRNAVLVTLSLLSSLTLAATGSSSRPSVVQAGHVHSHQGPERKGVDAQPIDWDTPIVNPVAMGSVQEAAKHVDFPPPTPRGLGDPRRVFVTHPDSAGRGDRVISFEYDHPDFGRFQVIQSISETNEAELTSIAARCLPETGCEAQASVEVLNGGTVALLLQGPTATSITWLRGRVRFDVIGPAGSFTAQDARGVAKQY